MRVFITGGGTGGHVYPLLAVCKSLERVCSPSRFAPGDAEVDVLYLGSARGMEVDLAKKAGLRFRAIASGAIVGRGVLGRLVSGATIVYGAIQALGLFLKLRPSAVLATGGYVSVPVVVASWLNRTPILIYLPDVVPGKAIKVLSKIATRVAVTSEASRAYLPAGKTVAVGYPLRPELSRWTREAAREHFGVSGSLPVLVVLGGSRGAASINSSIAGAVPRLLELCEVIHVAGGDKASADDVQAALSALFPNQRQRYRLFDYLHDDMGAAFAIADLVVCRAGASILGELPFFGLPSILVPYPYAGAHQEANARVLVDAGAAVMLRDNELNPETLLHQVRLLLNDRAALGRMSDQAKGLSKPDAADALANCLLSLGKNGGSTQC